MVIDLLERNRVNIKDLILPEPKPAIIRGFDPTELIQDKDYSFLIEQMQKLKEDKDADKWFGLMWDLSSLKFACPGKLEQLDLQSNLDRFNMTWTLHILKNRYYDIPQYASYLTLLYPDNQRVRKEVSEFIPSIYEQFEQLKNGGLFIAETYPMLRAGAIVLASHSQPLGLDDSSYSMMLSHYQKSVKMHKVMDRPLAIAEDAATMRILFPDKPISDYLTPEDFTSFERKFKDYLDRPEYYGKEAFIPYAFDLKILSTESITLGENGLQIQMPQIAPSFNEPKQSLPIGRKF